MSSGSKVTVRTTEPGEYDAWARHTARAFAGTPDAVRLERQRENIDLRYAVGAFDGDEIVATALHELTSKRLPGGAQLPCTGVTRVSVAATHRRRGLLRAIMDFQLTEIRELGLPLAALWASEAGIYQRFGYGVAALEEHWRIERPHTGLGSWVGDLPGSVRYLPASDARPVLEPIFDRYQSNRSADMQRIGYRWDQRLADYEGDRRGLSPLNIVVHETSGTIDGYAQYRMKSPWEDDLPAFELSVDEVVGLTREAELGLWQYLFGVDLVRNIEAIRQPVDATLPWALSDMRRLHRRVMDSVFARVLDIPAAFSARSYLSPGSLVVHVDDTVMPDAGGRFRIEAGSGGSDVKRTDAPADLDVHPAGLAPLLMGTATATSLARAGFVRECAPGSLARADELLHWPTAAHSLYYF